MRSILIFLGLSITMLFVACDSLISDVDIEPGQPKLVVSSYLYPGMDTVKVYLTLSKPLYTITDYYSFEGEVVTDAQVSITHQNISHPLVYDPNSRNYVNNTLNILPGNTYFLSIVSSDGKEVTSSCTIPAQSPPEIEIISVVRPLLNDYERIINFRFRDLDGAGNYYHVSGGYKYQYGPMPQDYWVDRIYLQTGAEFVSDRNRDGEYFIYKTDRIYVSDQNNVVYLYIASTDDHYFNYHQSVFNFQNENPFSEPVPVYSNISGGLGVFAGFRKTLIEVPL